MSCQRNTVRMVMCSTNMYVCRRPGAQFGLTIGEHMHFYIYATGGLKTMLISQPLPPLNIICTDAGNIHSTALSCSCNIARTVLGMNAPSTHRNPTGHD